jgi:hypothetical protein
MMLRKLLPVLVIAVAFYSGLRAQGNQPASNQPDPRFQAFYGIWETNNDETTNYIQKSQVFVITPQPGGFTELSTQVRKDNSNNCEIHVAIFDGKPHQSWGGDPREFVMKLVDSHTYERMWWVNGKRNIHRAQVSPDGKKLTLTIIENQAQPDQSKWAVRVYDKKFDVAGESRPLMQPKEITEDRSVLDTAAQRRGNVPPDWSILR